LIDEGVALISRTLGHGPVGVYQVQAAIAALHAQAPGTEETDWPQIAQLYEVLQELAPSPVVTLNQAIAVAMVFGPSRGLELLAGLDGDSRMKQSHRLDAVRAHLLERAGDVAGARESYLRAAGRTLSAPERRYLEEQAERLTVSS